LAIIGCKIDELRVDGDLETLKRDLELYAALGIEAVEIPVHGLDAVKNGALDRRRLDKVKRILQSFAFKYSVHAPNPLNLMDRDAHQLHLSVFRATLEFAMEIWAGVVVYHAGRFIPEETFSINDIPKPSPAEKKSLLKIEHHTLTRLAEEFPYILICVENARPYLFHSPYCYAEKLDSLKDMVVKINRPNLKIALDTGHLFMAANFYRFNAVEAVRQIKNHIAHTHVHDNFGGSIYHSEKTQTHQIPFGRGDAHMPVGWGEIPFAEILDTFIHSYRGMLMMELRNRYFAHIEESRINLLEIVQSVKDEVASQAI